MANQHKELAETVRKTLLHSQHSVAMVDGAPSFFDPALQALDSLVEQYQALLEAVAEAMTSLATGPMKDGYAYHVLEEATTPSIPAKSGHSGLTAPAEQADGSGDARSHPASICEGSVECGECGAVIAWEGGLPDDCLRCGVSFPAKTPQWDSAEFERNAKAIREAGVSLYPPASGSGAVPTDAGITTPAEQTTAAVANPASGADGRREVETDLPAVPEPDWDEVCEQYLRDQGEASRPASEPRYSRFGSSLYDKGEQNQERSPE